MNSKLGLLLLIIIACHFDLFLDNNLGLIVYVVNVTLKVIFNLNVLER
jgi:hypothetical protein